MKVIVLSKYTVELREILESGFDIGLDTYPIYEFTNTDISKVISFGYNYRGKAITTFREYLNNMIYNHFYFREIGQETPMRFKFFLNRKMAEIMPYYNQRFNSCDIEFNPLWNVDLTETFTHNVTDSGIGTATNNGTETKNENGTNHTTEDLNQDTDTTTTLTKNDSVVNTPATTIDTIKAHEDSVQNGLSNDEIRGHQFLTNADHELVTNAGTNTTLTTGTDTDHVTGSVDNTNTINVTTSNDGTNTTNSTTNTTNNNTRTETYTRKQEGSSAGYLFTQNIEQWRKIMVNIPLEIIDELEKEGLFMGIWS